VNIASQGDQRPNVTVNKYKPIAELQTRKAIAAQAMAAAVTAGDTKESARLYREILDIEKLLEESEAAQIRHLGRKAVYQA
jgi:division protein CdvB (Snf7/Vps24/ESCRT-III family)